MNFCGSITFLTELQYYFPLENPALCPLIPFYYWKLYIRHTLSLSLFLMNTEVNFRFCFAGLVITQYMIPNHLSQWSKVSAAYSFYKEIRKELN